MIKLILIAKQESDGQVEHFAESELAICIFWSTRSLK